MNFGFLRLILPQTFLALLALMLPLAVSAAEKHGAPSAPPSAADKPAPGIASAPSRAASALGDDASAAGTETALGGDATRTRFLIGIPKTADFQVTSLSNPNRVIVDIAETDLLLPPQPQENIAVGLVSFFRAGRSGPGKSRVVITVTRPVIVESAKIVAAKNGKGQRLALDIVPVSVPAADKKPLKAPYALGAMDVQPPMPTPALRPEELAARAFKPIIVIDPGHGGDDTGAVKNGTVEKAVVLAFSLKLKEKLEQGGRYKVLMTRDSDVFVPLGERVSYAERHNANLFIAIHADYADGNSKARGATIYSLREAVANRLQRFAKGDVSGAVLTKDEVEAMSKASVETDVSTVKGILADLAGRELDVTQERTSIFSRTVIENMGATTELRSEPDQQAAFRVLKTAQFPSVLIELAYVTNKEDAALLKSDTWRDKVSDSVKTAVDNYFGNQLARLPM